jgi:uncharacterized protein YbcI
MSTRTERAAPGPMNLAIANVVVHLYRRRLGRGPTRARAFCRDNLVVMVMEDCLTPGERYLMNQGSPDTALEMRRQLHRAMRADLVEAVEGVTGRRVLAFLSDSQLTPDIAAQMFVLEAPVDAGPHRPNGLNP